MLVNDIKLLIDSEQLLHFDIQHIEMLMIVFKTPIQPTTAKIKYSRWFTNDSFRYDSITFEDCRF